jgi:lysophospholipase L1-like esterase
VWGQLVRGGGVRRRFQYRLRLALAVVLVALALLPSGSSGATLAQVRSQLRAWHLQPPPLFPTTLPSSFQGVSASLSHDFDFDVTWSEITSQTELLVSFRRGDASELNAILNDPSTTSVRQVQIGTRTVYSIVGNKSVLAWQEQGRTYWLVDKYDDESAALSRLSPFVESLQPLTAPPPAAFGYVALGDSYSSGEANPPFMQPNTCDRSIAGAWPQLMARSLHMRMRAFLPCSGATTAALTASFKSMPAQLSRLAAVSPAPKLVTITIGGNDLGFTYVLTSCFVSTCSTALAGVEGSFAGGFGAHMTAVYRAIRRAAPVAHVVVVGYPQIIPKSPITALRHCPWLKDPADPVLLRKVTGQLDGVLARAASAARVDYVSTLNALKGHELCTAHSWVKAIGLKGGNSRGHPTAQGQAALAAILRRYVASHHLAS